MRSRIRGAIQRAQRDAAALSVAARDQRTPWYAKLVCLLTIGLALSPIDPIPDFIPVLGYLDDLVFIPLGMALAWRLTPAAVRADARRQGDMVGSGLARYVVAVAIVLAWLLVLGWLAVWGGRRLS